MILKAVILGIIEGLTEFLPVSSTGHLIIANQFFSFEGSFEAVFDIVIQFGAILAVVAYFRKEIFPPALFSVVNVKGENVKSNAEFKRIINLWKKIIIAFLPAAIIGVMIDEILEKYLFNTVSVSIALLTGAFLIIIAEQRKNSLSVEKSEDITIKQALAVGFFQCLAMWPGMSRSASTIIGGLFCGFNRRLAAEFSFFLGIPTIMGASAYKLIKTGLDFSLHEWITILIGTVISFIVALAVVRFFMSYLKKRGLMPFAIYRIILGLIILISFR